MGTYYGLVPPPNTPYNQNTTPYHSQSDYAEVSENCHEQDTSPANQMKKENERIDKGYECIVGTPTDMRDTKVK